MVETNEKLRNYIEEILPYCGNGKNMLLPVLQNTVTTIHINHGENKYFNISEYRLNTVAEIKSLW